MSILCIPALIRGRHVRDAKLFPAEEFEARLAMLRERMQADGVDVLILYSDSLSDDYVSWLTLYNNIITWTNAVLIVSLEAPPHLIVTVPPRDEKRVRGFTAPGLDVEFAGMNLTANDHAGTKAAAYILEQGLTGAGGGAGKRFAGVNLAELPHKSMEDLEEAVGVLPDYTLWYEELRGVKTEAERAADRQAAEIAEKMAREFSLVCKAGVTQKAAAAEIDRKARYAGVEDVQILTGEGGGDAWLHLPYETEFSAGQSVRVLIQVQHLRSHAASEVVFTIV